MQRLALGLLAACAASCDESLVDEEYRGVPLWSMELDLLTRTEEANARMAAQSSSWVDGEKKLKKKLKELQALQKEGKMLGVPVLTRWLGDDFPAWVEPGKSEDEWRAKVDAKYAEMRKEEEQWQKKMKAYIKDHERDIGITTA